MLNRFSFDKLIDTVSGNVCFMAIKMFLFKLTIQRPYIILGITIVQERQWVNQSTNERERERGRHKFVKRNGRCAVFQKLRKRPRTLTTNKLNLSKSKCLKTYCFDMIAPIYVTSNWLQQQKNHFSKPHSNTNQSHLLHDFFMIWLC